MSNAIFPAVPGMSIEAGRRPTFSTRIQKSVSGRETRGAFMAYPIWTLTANFEFLQDGLRGNDLQTMEGFFLQMRGAWDSFLVSVPADSVATAMSFGTGNGVQKVFQLTRTRGANGFGFTEPCQNIASVSAIAADEITVAPGNYGIDGSGRVTFVTAPAVGIDLTWSGRYYFRCRLAEDEADFERFLDDLWNLKSIEMIGAPGNKV